MPAPPRVARRLLLLALPEDEREPIDGDLREVFARRVARHGERRARLWYVAEALSFSLRFAGERIRERAAGARVGEEWTLSPEALNATGAHIERRQRVSGMLEQFGRDLGLAVRSLLRAPAFLAVTVATLTLAIGANAAIFSVIDAVLLDPLDFPEPDRLVTLKGSAPGSDLPEEFGLGPEFYVQYREEASALEDLGLYGGGQTSVRLGDRVERLFVGTASPSLYSTLRVGPVLGRLPTDQDEEGQVIVLSHWLWSTWFATDPAVIGQALEVSGGMRTVIGVMGPDFRFPDERISLWMHDLPTEPIRPGSFGLNLVGRLAPGATTEQLLTQMGALSKRLPERFGGSPAYARIIEQFRPVAHSLEEEIVGGIAGALWVLLGTVAIVLLIACANVANLLLVRAESRRRDFAVRRAIGASRGGLIRSQMSEAIILAGLGGVLGVMFAWMAVPLLVRAAPENIPGLASAHIDPTTLLYTVGIVVLAACAAGLLPALRFSNPELTGGLQHSTRVGSGPDHMTRDALVVLQTAAALVLLVASGLLFQSFRALNRVDPGYDTEDIFTFQMAPDARDRRLVDGPSFARFHYEFMDRLAALPGVQSVGLVNTLPLDEGAGTTRFMTERTAADEAAQPLLRFTIAGGDYFRTIGIRFLAGTDFERDPNPNADVRVIVSRSAADMLWPGEDPMDKRLRPAADTSGWMTVRGVVEDIMLRDFRQEKPDPMVYLPMVGRAPRSWAAGTPAFVVKSPRADIMAPDVRALIREIAPEAPMYRVFTMSALANRSMAQLRFTLLTLGIAAGLALVLGAIGLYGVLSYVVSRRTREIGIRMALGAQTAELRRMVVAQGSRVALVGVVIGLVGAMLMTRVLNSMLFGVRAIDPLTFTAMAAIMVAVAMVASYVPARRASAVDPVRSLRME